MKRPIPVILSAIVLGLLAAVELLQASGGVAASFLIRRKGLPTPPGYALPPSFLPFLMLGMSLFVVALAVWSILTLIGIVRLKSWARYSILVIAGCMTFFGAVSAVTMLAMPYLTPTASQPGVDPHAMRGILLVTGFIFALVAAVGIALLVYFNLAATRTIFLQNESPNFEPPHTSTGKPRPTAVTVISWIYMLPAPLCLLYLFLPMPAFLMGFIVYGLAAQLTYLAFGILGFGIGYGLFRLHNAARLAVFALFALCPIQLALLLTPWGSHQFHLYLDAVNAVTASMSGGRQPPPNIAGSPVAMFLFSMIGMAGYGIILWLLHRHRAAFTPAPPPPPLHPEPLPT